MSTIIDADVLSTNAATLLRRVQETGEDIEISLGGEVVARLIPAREVSQEERDRRWTELKKLGEEISKSWPSDVSAVEAVRDVRRDL